MALTLKQKAERQIAALEKQIAKVGPRYDKATERIEKKRATFKKQSDSMALAEEKYAKLDEKRTEALRYIEAMKAAIGEGTVSEEQVQAAAEAVSAVADEDEDGAEVEDVNGEDGDVEAEVL